MTITALERVLGLDLPQRNGYKYETSTAYLTSAPSKTVEIFSERSYESIGVIGQISDGSWWINPKTGRHESGFADVGDAIDRMIAVYES